MIATCATGVALWVVSGAWGWNGYPAEHTWGRFVAIVIALCGSATAYFIYRVLISESDAVVGVFYGCVVCWTLARLTMSSLFPLGGDEAYHWQWARRLDWCYYDHPGMVAWLARLCAPIGGHANALIRLSPLLLGSGTAVLVYQLGRMTLRDERLAIRAGLLFLLVPLFFGSALLMPMVAVTFFSVLTMALLFRAISRNRWTDWVLAGLALGAAFNSNFTSVLLVGLVGVFFLWSKEHRRLIVSPGPYVALAVALLCCLPMILWNANHDWVTLGFNLLKRHRETRFRIENVAMYFAVLMALLSPLLGIRMLLSAKRHLSKARREHNGATLFLAIMGFGPIVAFMITASFLKARPHYAAPALVPLLLLFVKECRDQEISGSVKANWMKSSARVAVAMSMAIPIVLLAPALVPANVAQSMLMRVEPARTEKTVAEFYGWPSLAHYLDEMDSKFGRDSDTILIAPSYAQASLVMTRATNVDYAYSLDEGTIPYGQQFSIWGSLRDVPLGRDAIIFRAGSPGDSAKDLERWKGKFTTVEIIDTGRSDSVLRNFTIYRAVRSLTPDLAKPANIAR
jgi:hypothetical protein